MSNLKGFLKELGTNAQLLEDYKSDPVATMQNAGLTQEEIDAVQNLDIDKIKSLLGEGCDYIVVVHNQHNQQEHGM